MWLQPRLEVVMIWTHGISSTCWVSLLETSDMCLMIMTALAIIQACICIVVDIGKFLIDLGFRNIFDSLITWSGNMLAYGRMFCCSTI